MATSTLGSGTLVLAGTTSGTTTVTATAVAGTTTLTLPAATDTLVGKATTDTLTNKTLTAAKASTTFGVGAATPSGSGSGITFPATQSASSDANTLDDYEEGTFAPTLTYSTSTSGVTYIEQTGHYTKIGNMVLIQGTISVSSKGTGSGSVRISLPFPITGGRGALAVGNTQQITGNNSPREFMIENGSSYFYIRYPTGSGSTADINYADISNGLYLVFSGVYQL